jgi:hypothetical protein
MENLGIPKYEKKKKNRDYSLVEKKFNWGSKMGGRSIKF